MLTVQKAIKIIDWWINQKKESMEKLKIEWDFPNDSHGVGKTLLDVDKTIIFNLETIRKELILNCRHPKKMRDKTPDGQWYCMNCNMDLK
jgi:hypothetical protein